MTTIRDYIDDIGKIDYGIGKKDKIDNHSDRKTSKKDYFYSRGRDIITLEDLVKDYENNKKDDKKEIFKKEKRYKYFHRKSKKVTHDEDVYLKYEIGEIEKDKQDGRNGVYVHIDIVSNVPGQIEFDQNASGRAADYIGMQGSLSDVEAEDLRRRPNRTRLDDLVSFGILGLDLKITPQGEVKVVEVNGMHSGMKGFKRSGTRYEEYRENKELLSLFSDIFCQKTPQDPPTGENPWPQEKLREHLQQYGTPQISYISGILWRYGIYTNKMSGGEIPHLLHATILPSGERATKLIHPEFRRYDETARRLINLENILSDKREGSKAFIDMRQYKPRSYLFTEKGREIFLDKEDTDLAVIKARNGACGRQVSIVPREHLEIADPLGPEAIIEPFILSKPIFSEQTGGHHDGCMRYMVIAEETTKGNILVNKFGGYWRLAPAPMEVSSNGLVYEGEDTTKANLSQGAIPEKPYREDIDLVEQEIDNFLPSFYRKIFSNIE